MRTIYKFQLALTDTQTFPISPTHKILSVGEQNGQLVLWAVIETDEPFSDSAVIEIRGTGHPICEEDNLIDLYKYYNFIGTVQSFNGLVWHIFHSDLPF